MSDSFFRFADIEYGHGPANEKIVGIFRFEQARHLRQGPAQIVVAEIFSALYVYEQLIDVINAAVEQSRTLMADMTLDPFARFEKLVQRLNEAVAAFLEKEPTPVHWDKVNIFILECYQGQLCVTGRGKLMNMFMQKTEDGSWRAFDLCGSLEQPTEIDNKKVFASLICGDMKPGDVLFLGSSNFNRLRHDLRIKERLSELPPVAAAVEIKRDLERQGVPDDFAAAVISCHQEDKPVEDKAPPKQDGAGSLKNLQDNIEKTNNTLAPVVNPIKFLKNQPSTNATPNIPPPLSPFKRFISSITGLAKRRRSPATPAAETALRGLHAGSGTVFTPKRKLMIVTAAVILVVGGIVYASWSHNRTIAAQQAAWEKTLSQAVDLRNQAEASLVYARDSQTRAQIEQSEHILADLDTSLPDHKTRVDRVRGELSQLRERLRKNVVASNIVELYSLDITVADGSLTAPVMTDTAAFVADNTARRIVRVDVATHATKNIALPAKAGRIVAGSFGDKSIVYIDNKGQLFAVGTADGALTSLNKISSASTTVSDFVLYNKKAYLLDGQSGNLSRFKKTDTGFGSGASYVSGSAASALVGGVGLAIDSNVYVAKADGTLLRYLSGSQEAFSLSATDPPLRSISGIWTDVDDTRIFITDPSEKRVVLYDKNGLLLWQISSPEFTSLRDIAGRVSAKQILVISGNRLLLVPLP